MGGLYIEAACNIGCMGCTHQHMAIGVLMIDAYDLLMMVDLLMEDGTRSLRRRAWA